MRQAGAGGNTLLADIGVGDFLQVRRICGAAFLYHIEN
jgi:hypothetical protein